MEETCCFSSRPGMVKVSRRPLLTPGRGLFSCRPEMQSIPSGFSEYVGFSTVKLIMWKKGVRFFCASCSAYICSAEMFVPLVRVGVAQSQSLFIDLHAIRLHVFARPLPLRPSIQLSECIVGIYRPLPSVSWSRFSASLFEHCIENSLALLCIET